jgi:hypothetical protein
VASGGTLTVTEIRGAAKSLYSVPYRPIGVYLDARADAIWSSCTTGGRLVKVHPRLSPGMRSTDVEDLPAGKAVDANRDTDWLLRQAATDGESIGCRRPWCSPAS